MNLAAWVVGFYGLVSVVGGVLGYVKAKSKDSLIAGFVFGALLLWAATGLQDGHPAAELFSVAIPLVLGLRFFTSWRKTRRVMPDLVMFALGLVTLAAVLLQYWPLAIIR